MRLIAISGLSIAVLSGCATGPRFFDSKAADAASIKAQVSRQEIVRSETMANGTVNNIYVTERFGIAAIDGVPVGGVYEGLPATAASVRIDPGVRRLTIHAYFSRDDHMQGMSTATVDLVTELKPSASYVLNGRTLPRRFIEAWLEDASTKERVTPVVTKGSDIYKPGMVIPIGPVPARR